jgi:gliding motility-associated-like protein
MRMRAFLVCGMILTNLHLQGQGFVPNEGQWEGPFRFRAELPSGALFLESNALTFHLVDGEMLDQIHDRKVEADGRLQHHAFKLHFVGSKPQVTFEQAEMLPYYENYYLGNDKSKWRSNVRPSSKVIYHDLYEGVDLEIVHSGSSIKYEFHLDPGVDHRVIQIRTEGLDEVFLDRDENLIMRTSVEDVVELAPLVYQASKRGKEEVEGAFVVSEGVISYDLRDLDKTLSTVIDPTIIFSTYSGSTADNWGFTAAPDNLGYLYAGGIVFGQGYPTTTGAFDTQFNQGNYDIGITKYDTTGTQLVFSTYLGGSRPEHPHSMIVDPYDNLYVMGSTGSSNFPTTSNSMDQSFNGGPAVSVVFNMADGSDLFVSAFNSSGASLIGSTFLGGTQTDGLNIADSLAYNYSDEFRGEINLDDVGNVYVSSCTYSSDFPITSGAFDESYNGGQDAVIIKLNAALTDILWSSFLGGSADEAAYAIDVATDGSVFVGGGTNSTNFPASTGALYANYQGGRADGFIAHVAEDGSSILSATYYGSAVYDQIYFTQLDRRGDPHFFGQTEHAGSNLVFNANWSNNGGGQILGVLEGELDERIWTTQFGSTMGMPNLSPTAFLVDVCNSVYISGWGGNLNASGNNNASDVGGLETTFDAFQPNPDSDNGDFYLAVIAADGNSLVFGSFYGGSISDDHVDGGTSRFDRGGQIYHSVCASCGGLDDFPIKPDPGAWSETNNSTNCNNAVFKIDFELPIVVADFAIPQFACAPLTLTLQNNSVTQSNTSFVWDFGNGTTSTLTNPTITLNKKGVYEIRLVVNDPTSCNLSDTLIRTITIAQDTNITLPSITRCIGEPVVLGPDPDEYVILSNATISWLPTTGLDNPNTLNPTASVTNSRLYRLVIDYGGCQERILQQVNIDRYEVGVSRDTIVCSTFNPFLIHGRALNDTATYEWSDDPSFVSILGTDSTLLIESLSDPLNYFYFRSTKTNGCQMLDTVLITVSDYDIELTADTFVCKNDAFTIRAQSENPLNTFVYYWTTGGFSTDSARQLVPNDQNFLELALDSAETFYLWAIGIAASGCTAKDSIRVTVSGLDITGVNAYAESDTFYRGQEIQLYGSPAGGGIVHYWTPDQYISDNQSATPTVRPKEASMYIWVVSDSINDECTFRDTIYLSPYEVLCDTPEIYVPTGFSPATPDGINDVLYVRGRNIKEMDFYVFDRWGNEVFYSNDPSIGWDGTYKGSAADNGVYVFRLRAVCITSEELELKGNLTKF